MWYCEDKLNRKTAHFRLSSVAQKLRVLKLQNLTSASWSCKLYTPILPPIWAEITWSRSTTREGRGSLGPARKVRKRSSSTDYSAPNAQTYLQDILLCFWLLIRQATAVIIVISRFDTWKMLMSHFASHWLTSPTFVCLNMKETLPAGLTAITAIVHEPLNRLPLPEF